MVNWLAYYKKLEKKVVLVIAAEFFLQLINATFMAILLIYMEKVGYADHQSASFISLRFLSVLLLAFPLGLFIKGRRIMPLFYVGCIGTPIISIVMLLAIGWQIDWLVYTTVFLWGATFVCMQVCIIPFILRNAKEENHTGGITLSYATWSMGSIAGGVIVFGLKNLYPSFFTEQALLLLISALGIFGTVFLVLAGRQENIPLFNKKRTDLSGFNWAIIAKAMAPTVVLSVGAGLTIPFIGLFFYKIHGLDSDQFALLVSFTTVFVLFMVLGVPMLKNRFGYKIAITLTQSIAIVALVVLAITEFLNAWELAVYLAMLCYIIRQPMMNMAGPMTSDLIMKYVGKPNQEMVSALTAAIWSGSWFISTQLFQVLRQFGLSYMNIFLITAVLYAVAVTWYYWLIVDFEKREPITALQEGD